MLPPGNGDADLVLLHRRRVLQQPADLNPRQISRFGCNGIVQIDGSSEFQPGMYDYHLAQSIECRRIGRCRGEHFDQSIGGGLDDISVFLAGIRLVNLQSLITGIVRNERLPIRAVHGRVSVQRQDFRLTINLRTISLQGPAFFDFLKFRFPGGDRKSQRKQAEEQKGIYFSHV